MTLCTICNKEYKNIGVHNSFKHSTGALSEPASMDEVKSDTTANQSAKTMEMLQKMFGVVQSLDKRLSAVEVERKGPNLKLNARPEDVQSAKLTREGIDPRISTIVDEILGEDFGIAIDPYADRPGFLFTVNVPARLSDALPTSRPIKRDDGTIVEEMFQPADHRSRAIASHQSFDAIRQHCEKVRAYIVTYFTKMSKPIPEFKLTQNV